MAEGGVVGLPKCKESVAFGGDDVAMSEIDFEAPTGCDGIPVSQCPAPGERPVE